ncbi:TPA: VOC family protein [Streptococcus suis]|uniref:VOC family protein n=1 Tax=Streptococcus suis TaxID=1307 RepID=UPI000CF5B06F|nr:VOC family protein [Streptococcus suis]MBS8101921.1 2,6-dichloro-p-hydroquinone 1,2-dioxygenase [Streptococcus suis]MCK3871363.1 2,6-dichloro-p-hydroquinone 1,2-dioxygenase [Streptococcus suis]NQK25585.1 2,6-dichloro-p-hydroquinone 1,2-dioxygenase [Streptococcus suis]HEM2812599.1 VOC family protein [Streptococcus suis]HEM4249920.1 VOC family protein [Streptococcus suis]
MNNTGIHHISSLVGNIQQAYHFYHHILGLKLTLKTVNQEDSSMYHLFFGDEEGRFGTEFTIFDMPNHPSHRSGSNRLERTVFLVKDFAALEFWQKRLTEFEVENEGIQAFGNGHILNFQDEDGQLLGFTYHKSVGEMFPYKTDEIPSEYAILGIASLHMRIREEKELLSLLTETFGFVEESRFVFEDKMVISLLFDNTFQHRLYLILDQESPISVMGVGAIHHIAFGVLDESDLEDLISRLNLINRPHSGIINRDFIHSLYFRAPNYLMFEVATMAGEREATMPRQDKLLDKVELFLPSFFEEDRQEIEKTLSQRY